MPETAAPAHAARILGEYGEPVVTKVDKIAGRAARPYSVQVKLTSCLTGPGSSPIWHGSYATRAAAVEVADRLGRRVTRWADATAA